MRCHLGVLLFLAGCTSSTAQTTEYPPARWRFASDQRLAQTMLYVSHILIRHSAGQNDDVCFSQSDFHSTGPAPVRTRDQARALAERLADQARAEPSRFAGLAREHSEDIVRREQGGSLGYTTAFQLKSWPEVLDALAALRVGQVSSVVETSCGFHVLRRDEPPPLALVSGVRLVIGHEKAGWLGVVARRSTRSREAALKLAWQLYAQVSEHPERFADLIREKSESPEAIVGGDLGAWSTQEPTVYPSEVEALDKLPVGGVSPPMDSLFGVEILMRTPNRARQRLALEATHLAFDREAPSSSPESAERVFELARAKIAELREAPGARTDGVSGWFRQHWLEGHDEPVLTAAVQSVELGELLPEPVRWPSSYLVGRRIDPPPLEPAEVFLELPNPSEPDIPAHIGRLRTEVLREELGRVADELRGSFDDASLAVLLELISQYPAAAEGAVASYQKLDGDVQRALGTERYEQYRRALILRFESLLLTPRTPRG